MRLMNRTVRALVLTAAISVGVFAVMAVVFGLALDRGVWAEYDSFRCDEYCEYSNQCDHEIADRPAVQQPANTWSNLFFLLAGLLVVTRRFDVGTMTFALSTGYLFLGSFLFHASITRFWQVADVAGIYAVLWVLVGHAVHRTSGWAWHWIVIPVGILDVVFTAFKRDMDSVGLGSTVWLIVFLVILVIFVAVHAGFTINKIPDNAKGRGGKIAVVVTMAILPGVLFGLGFMCRALDVNRTWCDPDSAIQGHAFWHFFAAVAMYFTWRFFDRSRLREREPDHELTL